jgi:cytochrome c oxidase subunit 2
MGRMRHFVMVLLLTVVSTVALRFLFRYIFALPVAASAEAVPIDLMFNAHFWMIAFLFSLIMVFMLYSVFVFRRKDGDDTDGPHTHGNTALEIGWTIVPTFVVLGFGVWGAITLNEIISPKPGEMTVRATGKQWVWTFEYPEQDGIDSAELVLPVGRTIVMEMEAVDVLHSFWVPEFRVKQDLVPGKKTYVRITPTETGEYTLRCSEICGMNHTQMVAPVRVLDEAGFQAWVDEELAQPLFGSLTPEERGAYWASAEGFGCIACHSADGSAGVGPTWQGLYGREEAMTDGSVVTADEAYIRNSILNPNAQIVEGYNPNIMPQNYGEQFAARQDEIAASEGVEIDIIEDLIAYIKTLSE